MEFIRNFSEDVFIYSGGFGKIHFSKACFGLLEKIITEQTKTVDISAAERAVKYLMSLFDI